MAGFGEPQLEQERPVFTAPQEQVQLVSSGFLEPQLGQKLLEMFTAPQLGHVHPLCNAGFFAPQLGQKLLVILFCPQAQFQPASTGATGAVAC